jgi:hypothetical protein
MGCTSTNESKIMKISQFARDLRTPIERIVFHLLSNEAGRPGPCEYLYDSNGRLLPDDAELAAASFAGRRYWDASDPRQARWAYEVVPVLGGRRLRERGHGGTLLPDESLREVVDRLLAVQDYARWCPEFAVGQASAAREIWGMGTDYAGKFTRQTALRRCILGLSRERQLVALALAGIACSPETLMSRPAMPKAGTAPRGTAGFARGGSIEGARAG